MKLYYKPGACSLASHIALREAGADFDLEKVDTGAGVTETGADFLAISAMGYVPALTLFDGETLTEGPAILQHIADSAPETGLAPAAGSRDRTTLHARLIFVASELHRAFAPFFASEPPEGEAREKPSQSWPSGSTTLKACWKGVIIWSAKDLLWLTPTPLSCPVGPSQPRSALIVGPMSALLSTGSPNARRRRRRCGPKA